MNGALGLLVRSTLRFMRTAPGSTLSVFAGVMIGIISITGVHLLGERIGVSLEVTRPAYLDGVTHVLTRDGLTVADYAALRSRWRQGSLGGIAFMVPVHESVTAQGIRVVGTDWMAALDAGHMPTGIASAGFLDDAATAGHPAIISGLPHEHGAFFELAGVQLRVAGRTEAGRASGPPLVVVDIGTAYAISGQDPQRLDAILVSRPSPLARLSSALEAFMPGISAGLPQPALPAVAGFEVHPVATELPTEGLVRAVLFNLGALGSLSLVVALLLMYQTCTVWLRRQRRVLGSLRDVGVSTGLLASGFIGALLLLAAPATALGLVAGHALAEALLGVVLGEAAAQSLATGLFPGVAVTVKAVIAGAGIALLGGACAWWREWASGEARPARVRWLVITLVAAGTAGWLLPGSGLTGIFLCILCYALLAAFAAAPLLRRLRQHSQRLTGPLWFRLGLRETGWFPEDLAVACAALALAVAVSIGVGVMVDSFRREFAALLDARLAPDVLVAVPRDHDAAVLATAVRSWPGVTDVVLSGEENLRVRGLPVVLGFTVFDDKATARYGHDAALLPDEVLVNEPLAALLQAAPGAEVTLAGNRYRVAGVFKGYGETGLRLLANPPAATRLLGKPPRFSRLSIDARDPDGVMRRLQAIGDLDVSLTAAVRTQSMRIFDRTFATSDALTWLALAIAAGALLNALAGFRLSQQATGQLLDALGVGWPFNLGTSLVRALVVVSLSVVIALPLGLWLGYILCAEVNPRAFGWTVAYTPSARPVLLPLAAALLAAAIAGIAGGFTRLPVLRR